MTNDAWPSPDAPSGPLPRIEDLPIAEQGYDQESVRLAFDAFFRHAAQLDASLRALETVEVFRRDADALRNDLRALRALGFGGGGPEPAWTAPRFEARRPEIPGVVLRLAAEATLIVAVAVIAGVAHFRPAVIVALMAAAFVIVALSEWLAGRARFVPPAVAFLPPVVEGAPASSVEPPGPAWGLAAEPDEETEPEALTIVASLAEVEEVQAVEEDEVEETEVASVAAVDPWEVGLDPSVEDGEPEPVERAGLFRRRRR